MRDLSKGAAPADRGKEPQASKAGGRGYWCCGAGAMVLIAVLYLSFVPMNMDVAWLLYTAERVVDGARLYVDILETNPPQAVNVSIPPAWLARVTGWSPILLFYVYFSLIIGLSLWLCGRLITLILADNRALVRRGIFFSFLFIFLVWPLAHFGQREHLLLVATMPYILAAMARSLRLPLASGQALLIGTLAGVGLSLKPHYLLLWLAVESYLGWRLRLPGSWRRPENAAIAGVLVAYGILVLLFHARYWEILVLLKQVYFAYEITYLGLLVNEQVLFCLAVLILSLVVPWPGRLRRCGRILSLATLSLLLTALVQKKGWTNHLYPGVAGAFLLVAFTGLLLLEANNQVLPKWGLSMAAGVAAFAVGLVVLGGLNTARLYRNFQEYPLLQLLPLARQYARGQPLYLLSTNVGPGFPLVNYAGASWPYHFASLWPLPGLYLRPGQPAGKAAYHTPQQMGVQERQILDTVIEDLYTHPPALFIVDQRPYKAGFRALEFDFLEYFSQDPRFVEFLRHYTLLEKSDGFLIWKRRNLAANKGRIHAIKE